jgi:pimeloyl-ACP methyl ester carboxylesterase
VQTESYLEFATIIDEFTTVLNIHRFSLIGFSSGGPYAVACAAKLASRVMSLTLIAADGEYANPELGVEIPTMYGGFSREDLLKSSEDIAQANAKNLAGSYESMANEARKLIALQDIHESVKNGFKGVARDCILETQPWDFVFPKSVGFPIDIYHGTNDESVPVKVAEWYGSFLPSSKLHLLEGENHSLIRRKWEDILAALQLRLPAGSL